MFRKKRLLGFGLILGLAACTQAPATITPLEDPTAGLDVATPERTVQQSPAPWERRYGDRTDYGYGSWQSRRARQLATANRICGDAYRDCISQDMAANPGVPGALFGGSPEGRAACERAMDACYRRFRVTPPSLRVN